MRRIGSIAAPAVLLAACATPAMVLVPSIPQHDRQLRTYAMTSDVTTLVGVPGAGATDRVVLRATVTVDIGDPTAIVTLTPTHFERDGTPADPPAAQTATVTFDAAGTITKVAGATPEAELPLGGSADDLGALFGTTIRRDRVKVADRWRTALEPAGERRSRVSALRHVGERRCAIVESVATRPVERTRETNGTTLRLTGTETSIVETAFAFDDGLVVSLTSTADGTFTVSGAPQQGTVTITSRTTLRLTGVKRTPAVGPSSPTPRATPPASPRATPPATPPATPRVTPTGN